LKDGIFEAGDTGLLQFCRRGLVVDEQSRLGSN
jgi:hypothetical protein